MPQNALAVHKGPFDTVFAGIVEEGSKSCIVAIRNTVDIVENIWQREYAKQIIDCIAKCIGNINNRIVQEG